MAYLAVTRQPHSRDALAALLWPEYDQSRGYAALRRTLSVLNKALGGAGLEIERESIGLAPERSNRGLAGDAKMWIDIDQFRARLAAPRAHGHPETETCPRCVKPLTEAAELYRGDFLAGFSLRDSPAFDDWQFFHAEDLRRELLGALDRLVCHHTARGESRPGIAHARRWLSIDPLHEPAHRHLMQLYAQSGQRSAALRQYQECARILKEELGVAPLEETTRLYEAIKDNKIQTADHRLLSPERSGVGPPTAVSGRPSAVGGRPSSVGSQYPLVGRKRELESLTQAYATSSTDGRFAVIEGETGIGKTRLAEEFMQRARERGATMIAARGYEGEANLPHGLFIDALRGLIGQPPTGTIGGQPDRSARLDRVPAIWLSQVARLLPELIGRYSDLPPVSPLDGPSAQSRFFEGIRQAVLTLCDGASAPGVLFLDNLHWADEASLDLLTYLVRRLSGQALFILAAWRSEDVPIDHRLSHLVAEAQRAGSGTLLALSPLDRSQVGELVRSIQAGDAARPDDLSERLYRETEGVPFFVVEYLEAMSRRGADWSMPAGVRDLLRARFASIDEAGRQLLQTAVMIGRSFDLDTLREASGRSDEETVTAIEKLVAQRLIREMPPSDAAQTPIYDFSHEKLRELIYEETGLARRRLLHQRVANALVARGRKHKRMESLAGQIAYHFQMAGQTSEAADYFWQAGEQARALFANVEALSHYRAALASGHPDAAQLHEAIGDLGTLLGEYRSALNSYETAAALYPSDAQPIARIEHHIGNVYQRQGERDLAETHYRAALNLLGEDGDPGARAQVYTDWSLAAHHHGRADAALELAGRALQLADAAGDQRALAQAHNVLGVLARHREDFEAASRHLQHSLAIAQQTEDPIARVAALNNLSLVCGDRGDIDQAVMLAEQALAACAALGDRHREAALRNNLADLLHRAGRPDAAIAHLKQAVTIFAEIGQQAEDWQPEIWKLTEW
jgi:predicted ATPase